MTYERCSCYILQPEKRAIQALLNLCEVNLHVEMYLSTDKNLPEEIIKDYLISPIKLKLIKFNFEIS